MKKIALFPGSFDPFTKGHADIAERASLIFDKVIIGIGTNNKKSRFFSLEDTLAQIERLYVSQSNIEVQQYKGLTAKFAETINAKFLIRGLRNTTDFEYENSIAQANRLVFNDLETVFIITSPQFAHISSSIIRELHRYGQNVDAFMPYPL